ncbi:MAG: Calx-beta domain-containing protein [Planctomycetaceae bacterium]
MPKAQTAAPPKESPSVQKETFRPLDQFFLSMSKPTNRPVTFDFADDSGVDTVSYGNAPQDQQLIEFMGDATLLLADTATSFAPDSPARATAAPSVHVSEFRLPVAGGSSFVADIPEASAMPPGEIQPLAAPSVSSLSGGGGSAQSSLPADVDDQPAIISEGAISQTDSPTEPQAMSNSEPELSSTSAPDSSNGVLVSTVDKNFSESDGVVVGKVILTESADQPIVVSLTAIGSTASQGSDFALLDSTIIVPAGATSASFEMLIMDDTLEEATEAFYVTITDVSFGEIGNGIAAFTIQDNDGLSFSIPDATFNEASGMVTGVVVASRPVFQPAWFQLQAFSETADFGNDFYLMQSSVYFGFGTTQAEFSIVIADDTEPEADETFRVGTTTGVWGTFTIQDNDDLSNIVLSINDASFSEDAGSVSGVVTASESVPADIYVFVNFESGTATYGSDYSMSGGYILIPAGQSQAVFQMQIVDDFLFEGDEVFHVSIYPDLNVTVADGTADITIIDDEDMTDNNMSIDPGWFMEEDGTVYGTLRISQPHPVDFTADLSANSGTAIAGTDFSLNDITVTIPAGQSTADFALAIIDDDEFEGNENFTITAAAGPHSVSETFTIFDDYDAVNTVVLSIEATTFYETDWSGFSTVSIDAPLTADVIVDLTTFSGTATDGTDFSLIDHTVTIPAGFTSADFWLNITDDTDIEGDEEFTVSASAGNATASQTFLIIDNDDGVNDVTVSITGSTVDEAAMMGFGTGTVSIDQPISVDLTVNLSAQDGTATHGTDFSLTNGSVTILAGMTSATFRFNVTNDDILEGDENFMVTASAGLSTASAEFTIADDDDDVNDITISVSDAVLNEDAGTYTGTVTFNTPLSSHVTIALTTVSGTATAGQDFVLNNFAITMYAGQTSAQFQVQIIDDTEAEDDEQFVVSATAGTSAGSATLTIVDNDVDVNDITVSVASASFSETAGYRSGGVTISQALSMDLIVPLDIVNGKATHGQDFDISANSVTIPAGYTYAGFTIAIHDDYDFEGDEDFTVTATAGLLSDTATFTIVDDEGPPPILTLSIADSVDEGAGVITGTVHSNYVLFSPYTVVLDVNNGDAIEGLDFTADGNDLVVVIPAGSDFVEFSIPIIDDNDVEGDEDFHVAIYDEQGVSSSESANVPSPSLDVGALGSAFRLSSFVSPDTTGSSGTPTGSSVVILDNEVTVLLAPPDFVEFQEGEDYSGFPLAVRVDPADFSGQITVDLVVTDITTEGSADYTVTQSRTISSSQLSNGFLFFPVSIVDDHVFEPTESFRVDVGGSGRVTRHPGATSQTFTIYDNDPNQILMNNGVALTEGESHSGTVRLTNSVPFATTVNLTVSSDKATVSPSSVTIPAGQTVATSPYTVTAVQNSTVEADQPFTLNAIGTTIASGFTPATAYYTFVNDDFLPKVSITATDATASEVDSEFDTATFRISHDGNTSSALSVSYNINGTATNGTDYAAINSSVTIPAGQSSADIVISAIQDTNTEGTETVSLTLVSGSSYDVDNLSSIATATIIDAPPEIEVQGIGYNISHQDNSPETWDGTDFGTASVNGPTVSRQFTIFNSGLSNLTVGTPLLPNGFSLVTTPIGILAPGTSRTFTVAMNTWTAGTRSGQISIPNNDSDESPFVFSVRGTVTALPTISISASNSTVTEPGTEEFSFDPGRFTISRTGDLENSLTVNYIIDAASTAVMGQDYSPISSSVTLFPWENSVDIDIFPYADSFTEEPETVVLRLLPNSNYNLSSTTATVTIEDAPKPVVSIVASDPAATEPRFSMESEFDSGRFTISRDRDFNSTLTVLYTIDTLSEQTATNGSDYTSLSGSATFMWGESSVDIEVEPMSDDESENPELVTLTIVPRDNYNVGTDDTATVTIEDAPPWISVSGNQVEIEDGDTTPNAADGTHFGTLEFGSTAVWHQFTVTNESHVNLHFDTPSLPPHYYAITSNPLSEELAPGESDSFTVAMNPVWEGESPGNISFGYWDDMGNTDSFQFAITTVVTAAPQISVTGNGLDIENGDTSPRQADNTHFGTVALGSTTIWHEFTVTNDGDSAIMLDQPTLPPGYFRITTNQHPLAGSLAPGASDAFTIAMNPAWAGERPGNLTITYYGADGTAHDYTFALNTFVGGAPEIEVSGNAQNITDGDTEPNESDGTDFGTVLPGGTAIWRSFTVTNTGDSRLTLGTPTLPLGYYAILGEQHQLPEYLDPGQSDFFTVALNPNFDPGEYSGNITIPNNDSDENPFEFEVTGSVLQPPTPTISMNSDIITATTGESGHRVIIDDLRQPVFLQVQSIDPASLGSFQFSISYDETVVQVYDSQITPEDPQSSGQLISSGDPLVNGTISLNDLVNGVTVYAEGTSVGVTGIELNVSSTEGQIVASDTVTAIITGTAPLIVYVELRDNTIDLPVTIPQGHPFTLTPEEWTTLLVNNRDNFEQAMGSPRRIDLNAPNHLILVQRFEQFLSSAETVLATVRNRIATVESMLANPTSFTHEQFFQAVDDAIYAFDLYFFRLIEASLAYGDVYGEYGATLPQSMDDRFWALPLHVDGLDVKFTNHQLDEAGNALRGIDAGVQANVEHLDNVETGIYVGAAIGAGIAFAPAAVWFAGTSTGVALGGALAEAAPWLLLHGALSAASNRVADGQGDVEVIEGTLADMTGWTSLNMGLYQVDPVTGQRSALTPGQRAVSIVGGSVQLVLVVVGVTAAGRAVQQEFQIASNQFPPGGGLAVSTPGIGGEMVLTGTLGATATGTTGGAVAGTLGVARPLVLYMTSEPGGLGGSGRPTPDDIAAEMEPDDFEIHGDPDVWRYLGEKPGSGHLAETPAAPPGTRKIYEVWEDEFGFYLEIHYFRHLDGSISNVRLHDFSP